MIGKYFCKCDICEVGLFFVILAPVDVRSASLACGVDDDIGQRAGTVFKVFSLRDLFRVDLCAEIFGDAASKKSSSIYGDIHIVKLYQHTNKLVRPSNPECSPTASDQRLTLSSRRPTGYSRATCFID